MNCKPADLSNHLRTIVCLIGLLSALTASAAWNTLTPEDSNTGLNIENAIVTGNATTVLFWTYPNIGDATAGKDCPLNFYTVALEPGLPTAAAQQLAVRVCGNALAAARLMNNGDVLILSNGRLERWREGEQLGSKALTELTAEEKTAVDFAKSGALQSMTAAGDVLVAVPVKSGSNAADTALQIVSLDADNGVHWLKLLHEPGLTLMPGQLWAASGGGAVIQAEVIASDFSSIEPQNLLYFIDAGGNQKESLELTAKSQAPDLASMINMSPDQVQKVMQQMDESRPESIKRLEVDTRADGGFDVLLQRQGGMEGREGHFLMRIGADGGLQEQWAVSAPITSYGLEDWVDFNVDDGKLVLLSRVVASQPSVQSKRKGYSQNVVSIINLDNDGAATRLLPLDLRYLQAVMDAGDEDLQYVENWPGGKPILLTKLGGLPLAVSKGHLSRRSALRINEATADLPAYTETFDQQRNEADRQAASKRRKANQEAGKAQLNADLAAAAGMSPEQFETLSNKDRKLAMAMGGNFTAIEAQGIKQAAAAQADVPEVDAQDVNSQIAAAMAQAQQDLPPELAEQVAAALAQIQQQANAGGTAPSATTAAQTTTASVAARTADDPGVFAMTVVDAFEIYGRGVIITGRVESGIVRVGDTVCLLSSTRGKFELKVEGIEKGRQVADSASAGDTPGILFNGIETGDVSRNDRLLAGCSDRQ